jgi:hypothetical protein
MPRGHHNMSGEGLAHTGAGRRSSYREGIQPHRDWGTVKINHILVATLVGVALGAAACTTDDAPTGLNTTSGPAVNASISSDLKAEREAAKAARHAEHERLMAQRDSLRAVYKEIKKESRQAYIAAKRDWEAYKHQWADYKKDHKDAKIELLRCEPLEFAADAEVIGPNGGQLQIGPHRLLIPKGALDHEQLIASQAPTSALVEVHFDPHGLQFAKSAQLTLNYDHCMRPDKYTYRIVYAEDAQGLVTHILEFPPSKDDKTLKEVEADINHFSRYMIAY